MSKYYLALFNLDILDNILSKYNDCIFIENPRSSKNIWKPKQTIKYLHVLSISQKRNCKAVFFFSA